MVKISGNNELQKRKLSSTVYKVLTITVGCALMALALDLFLIPYKIAPGGFAGIATIVFHLSGGIVPVGIMMLILNVPLLIYGFVSIGKSYVVRSVYGSIMLSVLTDAFAPFVDPLLIKMFPTDAVGGSSPNDLFLYTLVGGFLMGVGLGLVFRAGATTGGSDLMAGILNHFFPWISIGQLLMMVDALIIIAAAVVFDSIRLGLYAVVSMFVTTKLIDALVEGVNFAKGIYIITEHTEEVAKQIMEQVDRGITALYGKGMYSGQDKPVLLCVAKRNEISRIKEVVKRVDSKAFVFMSDIREVVGEGFIQWK